MGTQNDILGLEPILGTTPANTRVAVAMSGGVDSAVTAGLLAQAGYDVVGITLQLYDYGQFAGKKGACCAGQDIYDARRAADALGIPHYVLDYESQFRERVIDDFVDTYLQGSTPVPCIRCNERVKFTDLPDAAKSFGCVAMATGHYVQRFMGPHGAQLHAGLDPRRDQSYFLYTTTREQLDYLHFPLGSMPSKDDVRALAQRYGLSVAQKPDSQDICFVPDGDYAAVIRKMRPQATIAGDIVTKTGEVVGQHNGIINYTVGQRRGLRIAPTQANSTPWFVIGLDAQTNRVVVGQEADLCTTHITIHDVNLLLDHSEYTPHMPVLVRVRSTRGAVAGTFVLSDDGTTAQITLQTPEKAVAPGQAAVLYSADNVTTRVLGGGRIVRGTVLAL